jgi:hypothetical protein
MDSDGCSVEFRDFPAYRSVKTRLHKYAAPLSGKRMLKVNVWKSIIAIIVWNFWNGKREFLLILCVYIFFYKQDSFNMAECISYMVNMRITQYSVTEGNSS